MNQINLYITIIVIVLIKSIFLLTGHIQEDAFISWRVAQNLLDYNIIGFNGAEKISASTTHLYVFISYIFNLIFGKESFIYPILIFNSLVFSIGTLWLSKIFFKAETKIILSILFLNLLPPSIKISILGMEYGILFFCYIGLLYFGILKRQNWSFWLFPILILWIRIDTAIFLGIIFIVDILFQKKWNFKLMMGGAIGFISVILFNYLYFGDIINNTITAKSIAYVYEFSFSRIYKEAQHYFGLIKVPNYGFNPITILIIFIEVVAFFFLLLKLKSTKKQVIISLFIFAWVKQILFISRLSLFDWYYWIPQIVLFYMVIIWVLEHPKWKQLSIALGIFFFLPFIGYQAIHSIATGNGEWNYRKSIGDFLDKHETNKEEVIFLEPAGYVPYYSKLKTIDLVGLVDKPVQQEILKDRDNYIINTLKNRTPKYYLSFEKEEKFTSKSDSLFFYKNYKLLKAFKIKDYLNSNNPILEKIYHLKPSGRDYNLYQKIKP